MIIRKKQGFTLIELSVVLIIVGLLAGGVLVGRDLIAAAELRSVVSQIERYKTAINTFRTKYNCLPGDCADIASIGLQGIHGNGNGVMDLCLGCNGAANSSEPDYFWQHLSSANMLGEALVSYTSEIKAPLAKAGSSIFLIYYLQMAPGTNVDGHAYFSLSKSTFSGCGGILECPSLAPEFTYGIDSKIDDGMPKSGTVVGHGGWNTYASGGITSEGLPNTETCINNVSVPMTYNVTNKQLSCGIFARFM